MSMTPQRWRFLSDYAEEVFGSEDPSLSTLDERAQAAGLPSWAVTADVGRFLQILVALTPGRLAIELGTLGGYSAIWIARGLSEDGHLVTIEYEDHHADFAEAEIASAGLADKVEVKRGAALEVIPRLVERYGPKSVDFVFIDAVKEEYTAYFEAIREMVAIGGLVVADNIYGTGQGWIDEGYGTDEFNRHVAADPDYEATATPMRAGLLIARRVR
jgi:caffeoyl-CoA O-methyltransferase